jgi:transposase
MNEKDNIPAINPAEVEALIARVDGAQMYEGDAQVVARLLRLVLMLVRIIEGKNASIARLKRLRFGPRSERRPKPPVQESQVSPEGLGGGELNQGEESAGGQRSELSVLPPTALESETTAGRKPRPGHGRLSATAYAGAATVRCEDPALHPGDHCPYRLCPGHLYDTSAPLIFIRLEGRPVVTATRYEQMVLRCSACQARFAAPLPAGVLPEKYDATADAAMALMKYGAGMPLYRLSRLQALMGVPLPVGTQFERCEAVADAVHPVYRELQRQAASGEVLHTDDTSVKILACLKENEQVPADERQGLHTTGIGARVGEREVALYFSGRRHSGENLAALVKQRPAGLSPPIVMADAEAKNWTGEFEQVVAKCLAHGRRQFVDIEAAFPVECQRVLDDLAKVYRIDAETRAMTPEERLAYHQERSGPIVESLREWIEQQLAEHQVEPNSALGKAMRYWLRHWSGLTRFLSVAGTPLDNNYVERILKRAVLHRKNALFFKTEHGAAVGDVLMSLIETCALNGVNAFDYLVTLLRQTKAVRACPAAWLPWSYRERVLQAA